MSTTPRWACKACAEKAGLVWSDMHPSSWGGWCGVGQHRVMRETIAYTDVDAISEGLGATTPEDAATKPVGEQLELL